MMKEGEEEDETTPMLSTPPADLRCHRLDGKGWHCKGWRLQDKVFCQKHYFEYRSNSEKKTMKESNGVKKNGQERNFKRNDEVGKLNLKKKFDLDVGGTKGLKKNGVESEDESEIEIVLALECDKKKEKFDLDGSICKKMKKNGVDFKDCEEGRKIEMIPLKGCDNTNENFDLDGSIRNKVKKKGVDCKDGEEGKKIEMIPLKGCDNKKEKIDIAVEAAIGVKDETMVKMKSVPEKEQAECRRSQRSNAGVSKGYCKEEEQVEMITVRESDKKRGKSDLDDCGGDTLVNDSSKGKKQGRGRPKKVGGSKRNYREEVEMITVRESDKKRGKNDLDDSGCNSLVNDSSKGKKQGRGRPKKVGGSKRNYGEEEEVEMIAVKESDKKREKSDLGDSGCNTLLNDSSKGKKQRRGRPRNVGGSKRNYREVEEVEMITVRESDKKREKSVLDGSGGDTLVDDSSKGKKRGRGRPRKVRGISNEVKVNGVESEEGGKIEMVLSSGFDNEKGNFGLAVEGDNRVQDETMAKIESVPEREKPELRQSKRSDVGGSKSCKEVEKVEVITVKEIDTKRGTSDLDTLVNDSSKGINGERSTKVEGEQTKSTIRNLSLMRHWLLVKRDRELEMKTAAKCGTMSNVGRNENLTTENQSTEEERNEDCKKGYNLDDGGPTVVKDSLNAVKSKTELLEESEDKKYDFAGGSENISRVSMDNLPKCNDETLSADRNRTLK